jgi:LmbE family N-acetylglucosaminyl deacetylase
VEAAKQSKPWVEMEKKRSPVRAAQTVKTCFALTGLNLTLLCNPGFQSSLRSLFHPGLCCIALSALSLTHIRNCKKYAASGETPALPGQTGFSWIPLLLGAHMIKRTLILFPLLLVLLFSGTHAVTHNTYPLPEERGTAGILAALEKLPVYVRVLEITAHPDDESAGTLTWLSRKYHAQTALFSLTRGEGGQNILGDEKYEALGIVRTGELLEACKYYGSELYFGNAVDFGFSKTAEETLAKWDHDKTLEAMVLFIRWWRPTIIISRFSGTPADGHGHHQATGILAREVFRAAATPDKYSKDAGALPRWQAGKFYVSHFGAASGERTISIPIGDYDPVLGRSYREIAAEGYSKHRTQGNGMNYSLPGQAFELFDLVDSSVQRNEKDNSFFDSLDTSLNSIAELAGNEKNVASFLEKDLASIQQSAVVALREFQVSSPEKSAPAVTQGIVFLDETIRKVKSSSLSERSKMLILNALEEKMKDFHEALNAVLGIQLIVETEDLTGTPGGHESLTVRIFNRGKEQISPDSILINAQGNVLPGPQNPSFESLAPDSSKEYQYRIDLWKEAALTRHYRFQIDPNTGRYYIGKPDNVFGPFNLAAITVEANYSFKNVKSRIQAIARGQAGDALRGSDFEDFQIVPPVSVSLEPSLLIIPSNSEQKRIKFQISVVNNKKGGIKGAMRIMTNKLWFVEQGASDFTLSRKGEKYTGDFFIQIPQEDKTGRFDVYASCIVDGKQYSEELRIISYPENWTRNYYIPAQSVIERFDLKIAPDLLVGYIPGTGDEIPKALEQIGVKVQLLSAADLTSGDLGRFGAIVTGIRAYNINEDLKANNQRLLDYVSLGGTLIVQYVRPERGTGPVFPFGPHPMSLSNSSRITVEDSPVKILDPANPIFNYPNKITEADFQGWVQERGLYFMDSWDQHYSALLSGNDPGEAPLNGGMLYVQYGKGHYVYTGYSWFRQLPAGVPGAYRIFANMLNLGRKLAVEKSRP